MGLNGLTERQIEIFQGEQSACDGLSGHELPFSIENGHFIVKVQKVKHPLIEL